MCMMSAIFFIIKLCVICHIYFVIYKTMIQWIKTQQQTNLAQCYSFVQVLIYLVTTIGADRLNYVGWADSKLS